jgi:ParB/RepB/Spo0J family partition protein
VTFRSPTCAQLEDLEQSIRRLGVIEPLLVGRRGGCYRVIAGMRRLRAAHRIGLNTVPCLVHDADEERLADMRRAVIERTTEPIPNLRRLLRRPVPHRRSERAEEQESRQLRTGA